jgi:DNA-binding NarL/FixJ family response regulator
VVNPIRVLVVDDHGLVRSALQALLAPAADIEVVAAAADGPGAVALARDLRPDVVLMDLSMPGMDGVQATRAVLELNPDLRVVALTASSDVHHVQAALDAGAVGYLLKDSDPASLITGIRQVAAGQSPLDPRITRHAVGPPAGPELIAAFTDRERQVLRLLARGRTNTQIGRILRIAERTVKAHLSHIYARLEVQDRTSAALWASQHLPPE